MALTQAEIAFNFKQAMNKASEVDNVSGRISRLSRNDLGGVMQGISSCWKGNSASAYLNKGNALQDNMDDVSREIKNIANEIRNAATRIYNAEMENLRISQQRQYK